MRKEIRTVFVCLGMTLLMVDSLSAAQAGATSTAPGTETAGRPAADRVMQVLGEKLQLDDDQKAKITPIIEARRQQVKDIQSDPSLRKLQKARKLKGILHASDKKIKALLTPDQRKEYARLEEQLRAQLQEQRDDKGDR